MTDKLTLVKVTSQVSPITLADATWEVTEDGHLTVWESDGAQVAEFANGTWEYVIKLDAQLAGNKM